MRWWNNWSPSTSALALVALGIALLPVGVVPARAQEGPEERYVRAIDLFNNAQMEDACEQLQQVENEKPNYRQTRSYLKASCDDTKRMYDLEEKLFSDGEQLFRQGRYDQARQKWDEANRIPLKHPKRKSAIAAYLRRFGALRNEERTFQEGVKFFNDGRYNDARSRFRQVVDAGGSRASEARGYLDRAEAALKQSTPPPPRPAAAAPAPTPGRESSEEQSLRAGLRAYYEGRNEDAERHLTNYIEHNGSKRALAFFFRGAARSARYFLSGEKDAGQKESALADFRTSRNEARQFRPPEQFVSPKILALFAEANPASSR